MGFALKLMFGMQKESSGREEGSELVQEIGDTEIFSRRQSCREFTVLFGSAEKSQKSWQCRVIMCLTL